MFRVDADQLYEFCFEAIACNSLWFKPRKELWEKFCRLLEPRRFTGTEISSDQYVTIKSFLLSRNEDMTDNKRLAFDKTIAEILSAVSLEITHVSTDEEARLQERLERVRSAGGASVPEPQKKPSQSKEKPPLFGASDDR